MKILEHWKNEREIERSRKAYEAGNLAGLYDMLCLCEALKMPLPEWALGAVTQYFGDFLCDSLDKKRGRNSKWKTQYRQDMTDCTRAETVRDCSEHSVPWDHVYYATSLILAGTFAAGAEHAIEASYKRYVKRSKQNPFRYYESKFILIKNDPSEISYTRDRQEIWKEVQTLRRKKDQG